MWHPLKVHWLFSLFLASRAKTCFRAITPSIKSGKATAKGHLYIWCYYDEELTLNSVQSSRSVVSDSLRSHDSQHARPPCPSQTPGVYSNSCPSSWLCHPAISSSVLPFSSRLQSLPASRSFPMSQLFTSGGQSIGVSASASVLPMNTQDWLDWLDLLAVEGTLKNLL